MKARQTNGWGDTLPTTAELRRLNNRMSNWLRARGQGVGLAAQIHAEYKTDKGRRLHWAQHKELW